MILLLKHMLIHVNFSTELFTKAMKTAASAFSMLLSLLAIFSHTGMLLTQEMNC